MEELVRDPTCLVEEMMLHTFSWQKARTKQVEIPPTQLLYQIPLSIYNAGSSLAHLRFDLTPPYDLQLQIDSSEWSQPGSFAQGLKSFKLNVGADPWWNVNLGPVRNAEEVENFERFLTVFTRSGEFNTLVLDFAFLERHCLEDDRTHDPNRTSIGPLMVNWHKHQNVHLKNCAINLEELRSFVSLPRKKPTILGLWYVYLLDGTCAEAVEILRRALLSGRLSQESVSNLLTLFLSP
jgi:hypothetical protein